MGAETKDSREFPLEPQITLELSTQPAHNTFTRHLAFENHTGRRIHLPVQFRKTGPLRWEVDSFPDGIGPLESLTETGNRSYWDRIFLECRGGTTTLPLERLTLVMRYADAPGRSPEHLNHAEIPIVDWPVRMQLLSGFDEIHLDEFARRSRYAWAGLAASDPPVVRMVAQDLGKSGSDGAGDAYGVNPKYRGAISMLCSEFVSWYYHQAGIKVNGKSLQKITGTQELHDLFAAEGTLYRYDSATGVQAFVHAQTNAHYTPQPGDFLERREANEAKHSMMLFRWLPGYPNATGHHRYNRAIVLNGPWPVTLRLVLVQEDEMGGDLDFWLGKLD